MRDTSMWTRRAEGPDTPLRCRAPSVPCCPAIRLHPRPDQAAPAPACVRTCRGCSATAIDEVPEPHALARKIEVRIISMLAARRIAVGRPEFGDVDHRRPGVCHASIPLRGRRRSRDTRVGPGSSKPVVASSYTHPGTGLGRGARRGSAARRSRPGATPMTTSATRPQPSAGAERNRKHAGAPRSGTPKSQLRSGGQLHVRAETDPACPLGRVAGPRRCTVRAPRMSPGIVTPGQLVRTAPGPAEDHVTP